MRELKIEEKKPKLPKVGDRIMVIRGISPEDKNRFAGKWGIINKIASVEEGIDGYNIGIDVDDSEFWWSIEELELI